jgi:hypothetical protein
MKMFSEKYEMLCGARPLKAVKAETRGRKLNQRAIAFSTSSATDVRAAPIIS